MLLLIFPFATHFNFPILSQGHAGETLFVDVGSYTVLENKLKASNGKTTKHGEFVRERDGLYWSQGWWSEDWSRPFVVCLGVARWSCRSHGPLLDGSRHHRLWLEPKACRPSVLPRTCARSRQGASDPALQLIENGSSGEGSSGCPWLQSPLRCFAPRVEGTT